MHRLRVAYLIDYLASERGGTETQLLETIRRLDRTRFDPFLICMAQTPWTRTHALPCKAVFLNYKGFLRPSVLTVLKQFSDILEHKQFHIVQTFFDESIYLCYFGSLLSRTPALLLLSRRDIGLGSGHPRSHRAMRSLLLFVSRRFPGIVVNCRTIKEHLVTVEKFPPSKIKVIPNGIALSPPKSQIPELYRRFSPDLWIGIVANLTPVKRVDVFLRALSILRDFHKVENVRAVILGEGTERRNLLELSMKLGLESHVHFEGATQDVSGHLQGMDIGVLCSDSEGLSNSILEYMCFSLPVVATRVGGNPELVDESNGICVPPGDPHALATALARLARDPALRAQLGRVSREKVSRSYSWDCTMGDLQEYYQQLLSTKRAG